ncbi:MAG: MASE1 domain-containing protein, partial [Ectothiorhodospiraceae bacterium]
FTFEAPVVPLIWPATGVALAAIWRFGLQVTVTVFIAAVLSYAWVGFAPLESVWMALGNVISAVVGVWLLRWLNFESTLATLPDLYKLLGVGLGITGLFSGFTAALIAVGITPELPKAVLLCWLADAMGVLLVAPLLVSLESPRMTMARWATLIAALVAVPLGTTAIYYSMLPERLALPLSYAVFPMVILVALRFPPWAAALAAALAAGVAIQCTALGKGPFAEEGMAPDLLSLHTQLALLIVSALFVAVLRQERLTAEERAREHLHTLARAGRINAMSALAAGIAHEINQPLCALSSYAQSTQRMLDRGASPEQLRPALERLVTTADRAADIVRRTRRFLAGGEADSRLVELNPVVAEACDLLEPECRRRDVELRRVCTDRSLPVCVEALGIQQVIVNLLQNAMESVTRGGNAARRWVRVETYPGGRGRQAVLAVTDGGPGLADPNDPRLFEPFATGRNDGTGLGLAIARSIVEAEGGRIEATNEPGAGARFCITLPLVEASNADSEEEPHG